MYASVLIEHKVKSLDKVFKYKIPSFLDVKIGIRVKVPFGKQILNGIVLDIKDTCELDEVKEIIDVIDSELVLSDELLDLGKYIKSNTITSLMSVYQAMMPSSLKIKSIDTNYQLYDEYVCLNKDVSFVKEFILQNKRGKVQNEILERLIDSKVLKSSVSSSALKRLLELDLVRLERIEKYRINISDNNGKALKLTDDQIRVCSSVSFSGSNTYLLHGVTGSGKTEVYLSLIEECLKLGKTALVLVPEISLTTQIVRRFYSRFSSKVAILHSALSQGEKYDEYKKILRGEVSIVVGTRSAVFAPLNNIGIIIVDEEHTSSYKQDNNPRYNAIDCAIFRSSYNNCPLILGSATPSLESYARALKGVYKLLSLDKRVGKSVLPTVTLVDMMKEVKMRNMIISSVLKRKISERLDRNEQIMLLLNRRGFSTLINCQNCGYTYKCPYCEISLTYHKNSNQLRCHYCGYTIFKREVCPNCKEKAIRDFGLGTEKLEEEISKMFPGARIVRMDADTTTKKGSHERIIKQIENREYDIIIGTQMISKGLDFPYVTLVGVVNADESLNIPDFRSGERTFSLLCQVAGRAGRSDLKGEVIIQTFNPDNKTLSFVGNQDYKSLFFYEMGLRKKLKYPPYYYLVSIKVCSRDYNEGVSESKKIANYLNKFLSNEIILGPTTASMFKLNNIYRFQIIIKYKDFNNIKDVLKEIDEMYIINKNVYLEIDNNPLRI